MPEKKIKKLQCKRCKIKTPITELVEHVKVANTGKETIERYHPKCLEDFLEEQKFKQKEAEELDELYMLIKDIHKLDVVPSTMFSLHIQPLRNGEFRLGKKVKKYKQGVPYHLMTEAYKLSAKSISYWKENKTFDTAMGELKYGFAIMVDNLPLAKKRIDQNRKAKIAAEQQLQDILQNNEQYEQVEYKYKKKKEDVIDISFLD